MAQFSSVIENQLGADLGALVEIMHESVSCRTKKELDQLVSRIQGVCGFRAAILILGRLDGNRPFQMTDWINHSYPESWIHTYQNQKFARVDPVFKFHGRHPDTRRWKDAYLANPPPSQFLCAAKDFGMEDGWTTGLNDKEGCSSLFSFNWDRMDSGNRHGVLLHLAAPYLHQAVLRASSHKEVKTFPVLTDKETQVLGWIKHGKSNWEIAQIVKSSERTVKFHIGNVLSKLGATNRGHAVAIAIENGL